MLMFDDDSHGDHPKRRTVRHSVYALIEQRGRIAIDVYRTQTREIFDLPGGGLECLRGRDERLLLDNEGKPFLELEEQALVREVGEETGLKVRPGVRLAEAVQCYRSSDGSTDVLGYSVLWTAEINGAVRKREANHELGWMKPEVAIRDLRHESHRLFVMRWLSWQQRNCKA